jgi:hypothetical protein
MSQAAPEADPFRPDALRHLVEQYASAVDRRDLDTAADLFADDAVLNLPDVPTNLNPAISHHGRTAIRDALGGVEACVHTLHAIVGHTSVVNARAAVGHTACLAHHLVPGKAGIEDWVWTIQYHDTYVNDGHRWQFQSRSMRVDWIEVRAVRHVRQPSVDTTK